MHASCPPPNEDKILELRLEKLVIDAGTQTRAELNHDAVSRYAEAIDDLPPVVVFTDGSRYLLVSGFHRYFAYRTKGRKTIPCIVKTGTIRDAVMYSVGENARHGLPRTPADNRHICRMLLTDPEWGRWSDKELSRRGRVSVHLVGEVRRQIGEEVRLQKEKEEAERLASLEQAEKDAEARAAQERAATREGWFRPGKQEDAPEATSTDSPNNYAASDSYGAEATKRTYRTRHGTLAQMDTSRIGRSRKGKARDIIHEEEDTEERQKIQKRLDRSIPKAIRQAKQLGLTWDDYLAQSRAIWDKIPTATGDPP